MGGGRGGRADPYEVLGLNKEDRPGSDVVRKAYHRLARVHHPDKARTSEDKERAEARFKEIGAAYELLSDPEARANYDANGWVEDVDPREAQAEERHARQMYCAAMGIPETVVREVWCTLEELFAGSTRREGVMVQCVDVDSGVPRKEAKVFTLQIRRGWRNGREIRFGAMGTNNLQSVTFVVRELAHPFFRRMPGKDNPDVKVWCALTPEQHRLGAVVSVPSLSGRDLRFAIKPNSSVVASRGTKTMKGEGFHVCSPEDPWDNAGQPRRRGDMVVEFRVMSSVEAWLRKGNRMRWVKAVGYSVGGVGAVWLALSALVWALDIDLAHYMDVPDALLLNEFPGSYGFLGTKMFIRTAIPAGLWRDWNPEGLGKDAAKMGFAAVAPLSGFRVRRR